MDAFGWYGIVDAITVPGASASPADGVDTGSAQAETQTEEEQVEVEYFESWEYDPWDVQSALDEAMSTLMKSELVPKLGEAKEAPSFSAVCAVLFGKAHELTKRAEYFEKLIRGYEDRVSKDDLREAYDVLESFLKDLGWKPEAKVGA